MRLAAAFLAFFLPTGPAAAGKPALEVVSTTPVGRMDAGQAPRRFRRPSAEGATVVAVTFNQPMVALSSPQEMGAFCPIVLEPKVPGRCRWQGTQSVAFEPAQPLPTATAFRAVIRAGTKSLVSGAALERDVAWEFETTRPAVIDSRPRHGEKWVDLKPQILAHFNLEMEPARARDLIELEESAPGTGTEKLSVGVRRASHEEIKTAWPYAYGVVPTTATVLAVKPSRTLRPDRAYRVLFKEGLPPAHGALGLPAARTVDFETWHAFRFVKGPDKGCLPRQFSIALSNPVRYQELLDHLSVEPSTPMPRLEPGQAEWTGHLDRANRWVTFSLPDIGFKPDAKYAFTIDAKLKDVYGNALGQDAVFSLDTEGYCPYVNMPQRFGILESYLSPRHPVTAVNAGQIPLQKAKIPDDKFIPFYRAIDWSCRNPQPLESPIAKPWNLQVERNARLRTFIDLQDVLNSGEPSRGGLVFSQLQAPLSRGPETCWLKAVDNVTRLALTFKDSPDSAMIWATFLKTGQPAAGVPVEIRGDDNKILWKGRTDAQGLADAPGWKGLGLEWDQWQKPKLWALAKDDGGSAVLSMDWRGDLSPWRFNIQSDWYPPYELYRGSLFSERGVYRPGETVLLKGIVRKLRRGDWDSLGRDPGDPRAMVMRITDPRGAEVLKSTFTLSAESSFDSAYALGEGAPTGRWSVDVAEELPPEPQDVIQQGPRNAPVRRKRRGPRQAKVQLSHSFQVEAFKPASFEVKTVPSKTSFIAGERYSAAVDGWYLFGAPMTDASYDWKLRLEPGFFEPPGYEGFDFTPGWWRREAETGRLMASGSGKLDGKGKAEVSAELDPGKAGGPLWAILEAGVSSPDRQRLFGRSSVPVHRADLYLGVRPGSSFLEKGKVWKADVVAVRPDGAKAEGGAVEGRLIRRDWLSVRRAGVGGRLEWVNERRDVDVSSFSFTSSRDAFTWTAAPDQPGEYIFSVSGRDEKGRPAEAAVSFYVTGAGAAWWAKADNDIVELVPDKKSYKPGDVARIMVKSPYVRARALVTVEREGIHARWLTWLEGGASFITVPIKEDSIPNVYVGVVLTQGRAGEARYSDDGDDLAKPQAKFGYIGLPVDPGGRRLQLSVAADKKEYRPREKVRVSLKALDESGRGVPAEVTVFAVDEGVLSLTGFRTPDAFATFYGPRPLWLSTADSRLYVIGQRSFGEKGKSRGGGGGRGPALEGIDLRTRFVPTAFWSPSVRTSAQGNAELAFSLPDNLSRFRLMAVAHAGKRFGASDSTLAVSKPLLLRPSLPRLARPLDEFEGGAVIHNYSSTSAVVTVELKTVGDSIEVQGEPRREVVVGPGKAVETLWKCRALKPGTTAFQIRASSGLETDGLEWKVPVRLRERLDHAASSGATEDRVLEELAKPADAAPGGFVRASFSPTALAGLQEGARFLLDYPYGCLEQRLSRMLPVIASADLAAAFGLGSLEELKKAVQKSLEKLSTFQHPSGGLGYWPNPPLPDPYITAYALEILALASKEGYSVPAELVAKAKVWLKASLSLQRVWAYPYSQSEDFAWRAFAVYALALHGEQIPGYFQQLYARRDQVPYLAKAYLLKAAPLISKDPAVTKTLAAELLNQSRVAPRSLHFEEPSGGLWIHDSNVRTTALALQALLEASGGFPQDEKAVAWLIGERKSGRWRTTQENAYVLRALQDFYRRYEKDVPDFEASLALEGSAERLWTERFQGRSLTARTKELEPSLFSGGKDKARLALSKTGIGRLYYTFLMGYAPMSFKDKAWEGFELERNVKPLYGGALRAGARAVVTLTVRTKQDRTFVALEDQLPAGFEIVDSHFAVESQEDARALAEESERDRYWGTFQRSEKYDDRIQVFADLLTAGEHKYSYLVQATTPGRFHVPAARVEGMYEPEVFGRTASGSVEIQK